MILGGDTVTRLRAPTVTGPDGVPVANWKSAEATWDKVDYPGGSFQPLTSDEDIVAQQRTESTHKWFAPAGADVLPTDRLRFDGLDYQVEGNPKRWGIAGREDHLEVRCFRITGG
jgi:hypothetical protein